MERIINFELIDDPRNWAIVILTLYLVALIAKALVAAGDGAPISLPLISNEG